MNKNAKRENLAEEIAVIPKALEFAQNSNDGTSVILARLVRDVSLDKWDQACRNWPLSQWYAFPVDEEISGKEMKTGTKSEMAISPFRDVHGALTVMMFEKLLVRELKRLERNGGSLSLMGIAISDRKRLVTALGEGTVKRLENILGQTILSMLETCDSLGVMKEGQFICSLPGLGQLATRNLAEKCQLAFDEAARPYFPTGGISAGQSAKCAIGIVNILQGEHVQSADLIKRAKKTLEVAQSRDDGYIHQETSYTPLEKTTLVHSREKQFLFFGGDAS